MTKLDYERDKQRSRVAASNHDNAEAALARHANATRTTTTNKPDAGNGVLFRNDQKAEGSKQPDFRGDLIIDGKKYALAAWVRTSEKTGRKFMSLALREA